jgi:AhpD family alkylhydroperoxidase
MAHVSEKQNLFVKGSNWYTRRTYGRDVTITPVIAHSPWMAMGWAALEFAHDRAGKVDERLKALAELKASTKVGCEFCIDIGSALGRQSGISEDQIRDFHRYSDSPAFSEEERLVMRYAEEMSTESAEVSPEVMARLREHFDDAELVELTASIAIENFRARFNKALDVEPAGFSEGVYCPLPDRAAAEASEPSEAAATAGAGTA